MRPPSAKTRSEADLSASKRRHRIGIADVESRSQSETKFVGRQSRGVSWPVFLFLVGLVIPWLIQVGPARLSVYRIVLLATLVPSLFMWLSGRAGNVRAVDIAIITYALWCALGLFTLHGWSAGIEPSGTIFIETVGVYFLARCHIRDADDFYNVALLLFKIVVALVPFAIIEAVTGRNVVIEAFSVILPTHVDGSLGYADYRLGLKRVQVCFDHPILFGVFSGSIFAFAYLVLGYGKTHFQRCKKSAWVALAVFLSLSAGPLSAVVAQIILLIWNSLLKEFKERWKMLWLVLIAMYVLVAIGSNQSVPEFYITHFSFDQASAYYRVLIWKFGSATALNHPFFGVGLNEWERPEWMPPSIDMFWLFHAIRYGIPAGLLMLFAFLSVFWAVGIKKGLSERISEYRTAYMFVMVGFFIVGWTVHFWNATYVLFIFLIGCGVWILDADSDDRPTSCRKNRNKPSRKLTLKNPIRA
jgi:hypothetical protein